MGENTCKVLKLEWLLVSGLVTQVPGKILRYLSRWDENEALDTKCHEMALDKVPRFRYPFHFQSLD